MRHRLSRLEPPRVRVGSQDTDPMWPGDEALDLARALVLAREPGLGTPG